MVVTAPSVTEAQVLTVVRSFLLLALPAGTEVVRAQINRVPEVRSANFVLMTPTTRRRLSTNEDSYEDVAFLASVAATTMTVTTVQLGAIAVGQEVMGEDVLPGTLVVAQLSGPTPGGVGTYQVSIAQALTERQMASGEKLLQQATEFGVQLDVHGPASAANAQIISTTVRDEWATRRFYDLSGGAVSPLHADDPREIPFQNGEQQWEFRWVVEAMLQVSPVVRVTQDFAAELTPTLIDVEAEFPA